MNRKEILIFSGVLVLVLVFLFGVVFVFSGFENKKIDVIVDVSEKGVEKTVGKGWPDKNPLNTKQEEETKKKPFNLNIETWGSHYNYENKVKIIYPSEFVVIHSEYGNNRIAKKTDAGYQIDFDFGSFSITSLDKIKKRDREIAKKIDDVVLRGPIEYVSKDEWVDDYDIYFGKKKADNCERKDNLLTCYYYNEESGSGFLKQDLLFKKNIRYAFVTKLSDKLDWEEIEKYDGKSWVIGERKEVDKVISSQYLNDVFDKDDLDKMKIAELIMNNIEFEYEWKKYRNVDYNFEFKYPKSWSIHQGLSRGNNIALDDGRDVPQGYNRVKFEKLSTHIDFEQMKKEKISKYRSVTNAVSELKIKNNRILKIETGEMGITRYFILNGVYLYEFNGGENLQNNGVLNSLLVY